MARGPRKPVVLAIKVPEDLAEFLDRLPNKSEFVRQAILAQMQMVCPLCTGAGMVAQGIGAHYKPLLDRFQTKKCQECRAEETIPFVLQSVPQDERPRWEQFFHGGPFLCQTCFVHADPCDECGWHLPPEYSHEHHQEE